MTNDINHGLALLADEVEPATVDTYAVIAKARARTRNRRTTGAAFLAVVAIGALMVPSAFDRATTRAADQLGSLTQRLNDQLATALPELIPSEWEPAAAPANESHPPANAFVCTEGSPEGEVPAEPVGLPRQGNDHGVFCRSMGWYRDSGGEIELSIALNDSGVVGMPCEQPSCRDYVLADGTVWQLPFEYFNVQERLQQVEAGRADGMQIRVRVRWSYDSPERLLTPDRMVKFLETFVY
jgi:hypothetical protein